MSIKRDQGYRASYRALCDALADEFSSTELDGFIYVLKLDRSEIGLSKKQEQALSILLDAVSEVAERP